MAKKEEKSGGCLATSFLIVIIIIVLGGCSAFMHGGSDDSTASKPKTHKVEKKKKKPTKKQIEAKKRKEFKIRDAQKSMSDDLEANSAINKYVSKIKYDGDSEAEIKTTASFTALPNAQKTVIAHKVNSLVTSDAEDDSGASEDPYSFLTFTYEGNLVGSSKQLSHDEYKWK